MIVELIDAQLEAVKTRGAKPVVIRLGKAAADLYLVDVFGTDDQVPFDGSQPYYKGIPVNVGTIDPDGVIVESEA